MADTPGQYSETEFWQKLKNFAISAGRDVIEKALILFYAAQRPETPLWAKTIIYSALAYFILPTDAIPDLAPIAGYTDDLTTLIAALGVVGLCITPEVKQAARQKMQDWFGEPAAEGNGSSDASTDNPIRVISIE